MNFRIVYGLGGGYNTKTEELVEANDLEEAAMMAYTSACEEFETYGVFENQNDVEEIECEADYDILYQEELERWVHYDAFPA